MTFAATNLDTLCIDTIRCLSMDAIQKANSGHPGTPMAQAPAAYVLWTQVLKHNPASPQWPDRDRFVLSCGHASMLIYSLLHLAGYGLELDDLSMNVLSIFRVKKILRAYTFRECQELVESSNRLSTPEEIENLVRISLQQKFPEEFRDNFGMRINNDE